MFNNSDLENIYLCDMVVVMLETDTFNDSRLENIHLCDSSITVVN